MKKIVLTPLVLLTACVVQAPPRVVYVRTPPPVSAYQPEPPISSYQTPPPVTYQAPTEESVVSVYVDPPLYQPEPVRVEWAPPPMLVESLPPMPYPGSIWIGGYWVWEGNWVWAHGRWASPPQSDYHWVHPYYENRGGSVIFVNGFWAAPGVVFVAPAPTINIRLAIISPGIVHGPRCIGPEGVFVPPPPGSHYGLIVPAPIGTSPAVVTGVPPMIRPGMHININNNNVTNINRVTNVTNITNVTVIAPPGTTANGQAVNTMVPAQAHLAAAMPPVVRAMAPEPVSQKPIPAYTAGRQPINLPAPQLVHPVVTPAFSHPPQAMPQQPLSPANRPSQYEVPVNRNPLNPVNSPGVPTAPRNPVQYDNPSIPSHNAPAPAYVPENARRPDAMHDMPPRPAPVGTENGLRENQMPRRFEEQNYPGQSARPPAPVVKPAPVNPAWVKPDDRSPRVNEPQKKTQEKKQEKSKQEQREHERE